ncbi:MAG: TetR/AcrR family transcriptional regulator [Chitinophagaceae bacterium]|nr:TetR/AcrR family transcriptional regulator [Anaerolineae bacterium]
MVSTRDQIIATTCDLLEAQGYHATGLNQIIKESGSPKGSLYYHFPGGKEELAAEAVNHVGRIVLQRIRDNLAEVENPAESISVFIKNIALNVERSGFRAGGPITTVAMEKASTSVTLREACQHIYSEWQKAFASKLKAGGIAETRAERLAVLIISAIEGGVILCRTNQNRAPLEQVADEINALVKHVLFL